MLQFSGDVRYFITRFTLFFSFEPEDVSGYLFVYHGLKTNDPILQPAVLNLAVDT